MRNVIDGYVGIMIILVLVMLGVSFTTINMDVTMATKIYNEIVDEVQSTNGAILTSNKFSYDSSTDTYTYTKKADNNAYSYEIVIKKESIGSPSEDNAQTFIYNDIYRVDMNYTYNVPIFGKQIYKTGGYTK